MELKKSIELYELIIKRLDDNLAPHQLDAYKKTLELIKTSSSVEESMEKIKNSPLYTEVGRALTMDNLLAKQRATEDAGFPEIAQIYADKLQQMYENPALYAYDRALDTKVKAVTKKYFDRIEAAERIVYAYIQLKSAVSSDQTMINTHTNDIKNALNQIQELGESFFDLCLSEPYSHVFDAIEGDRTEFFSDIKKISEGSFAVKEDENDGGKDINELMAFIKDNKKTIVDAGKKESKVAASYKAVPSADSEFGYEFIEIETEVM